MGFGVVGGACRGTPASLVHGTCRLNATEQGGSLVARSKASNDGQRAVGSNEPCRGLHPLRGPFSLAEGNDMTHKLKYTVERNTEGPKSAKGDMGEVN